MAEGLHLAWRVLKITFGAALVLVGIAGLLLPILQGLLLVLLGLGILSTEIGWVRRYRNKLKERWALLRQRRREGRAEP